MRLEVDIYKEGMCVAFADNKCGPRAKHSNSDKNYRGYVDIYIKGKYRNWRKILHPVLEAIKRI